MGDAEGEAAGVPLRVVVPVALGRVWLAVKALDADSDEDDVGEGVVVAEAEGQGVAKGVADPEAVTVVHVHVHAERDGVGTDEPETVGLLCVRDAVPVLDIDGVPLGVRVAVAGLAVVVRLLALPEDVPEGLRVGVGDLCDGLHDGGVSDDVRDTEGTEAVHEDWDGDESEVGVGVPVGVRGDGVGVANSVAEPVRVLGVGDGLCVDDGEWEISAVPECVAVGLYDRLLDTVRVGASDGVTVTEPVADLVAVMLWLCAADAVDIVPVDCALWDNDIVPVGVALAM